MSSELQHRLYNYEATVPSGIWASIAEALDDSHLSDKFPKVLYRAQTIPPVHSWVFIATSLQENGITYNFPDNLFNAEATPPASAWDKIAAALDGVSQDDLSDYHFPKTLYNATMAPPASAWSAIETALNNGEKKSRVIPFLKYAAAAAVLAAIVIGGLRFFNKTGDSNENNSLVKTESGTTIPPSTNIADATSDSTTTNFTGTIAQQIRDEAALQASKLMTASLSFTEKQRISRVHEAFSSPASPIASVNILKPQNTYRDLQCAEVDVPDFVSNSSIGIASRYIMLTTPDGRVVRISKKLGDMVCCVSGDEVDDDCRNQLDKWRQKVAASPSASPGDFMDVLNIIQALKENNL